MPAIHLARLRASAAELVDRFHDPEAFVRALNDLLEAYADRTRRPGQAGAPPPILPTYRVPPPVLREVLRAIETEIAGHPEGALALADALWAEATMETRLLAARVLGRVPPSRPHGVLERVQKWAQAGEEDRLLDVLLDESVAGVRSQEPGAFQTVIRRWLSSAAAETRALGLRALSALANDPSFENLPVIFGMLTPIAAFDEPHLRPYLLQVVRALAERTPRETGYFLKQSLSAGRESTAGWLIRKSLDLYPTDLQTALRAAMRESPA